MFCSEHYTKTRRMKLGVALVHYMKSAYSSIGNQNPAKLKHTDGFYDVC
jgi:hypothetical protein